MSQLTARQTTSTVQHIGRILLGIWLSYAGLSHLIWSRTKFLALVPQWLPVDGDLVVVLSGIIEIILGLSLVFFSQQRVLIGWVVAAFFVVVFPGNVAQFVNHTDAFGLHTDRARLIRLFFQPLLVVWSLWSTGAWQRWRSRQQRSP